MRDASPWLPRPRLVPRHDGAAPSTSRLVSMASPSPERPRRGAPRAPVPAAIILLRLKSRVAKPSPCPRIRPVLPSAVAVELVGVVLVPSSPGDPSWTCCCRQVPPAGVPAPAPRPSKPLLAAPTPCQSFVFHHGRGGAAEPRHGSVLGFVKTAKTHTWIVKFDYTKPPSTTTIADAKTGPTSTPMTVETAKFHYRRHVRLHHGHT